LGDSFASLARDALKHNSSEFLKLAEQNLQVHHSKARQELSEREKAVESLVRPIREALSKTEQQIQQIEKDRHALRFAQQTPGNHGRVAALAAE